MRLLWGLIWMSNFFALSLQKPRLLLFSPSVVHLGVPLSVGLQLQDAPRGQVVTGSVFLRNPSGLKALCSPQVDFTLSSEKDFVLLSLQVSLKDAESCGLHLLLGGPEVQLVAKSPWLKNYLSRNTDIQGVNLRFSSRRGHLFLQTDQPVYNPGQRVRYRVFALDQNMRPSTDTLTVTVENSHGLLVRKKEVYTPSSLFQDDFVIPDISEPGTWKISARFSDGRESNSSTQFEVKKYVLPNFEVKIVPGKPYILTTPGFLDEIQLDVQARYIYGKPVQGVAYVRFGLLGEDGDKTFLRGLESQTKLVDGQCHISLSKAEVQGALEKLKVNVADLPGLRLYVAAAIIESPGGEMEEAELTSWRFVSSPFSLDLSKTKRHLVPGAPFLLQALVRDMSGSPASGVPVKVSATLSSGSASRIQDFERNTDGSGQVIIPIATSPTISEVQLLVSAGSPHPAIGRFAVRAPRSGSPFLSIVRPDPRPPRVGDTLILNLQAVGISGDSFSHYYYMILSRGRIVSVNREPRGELTSVSVFVDHHLVPSFYLVAFYYHGGIPVANSLRVDVQVGACEGKLELNVDSSKTYHPGEPVKLQLQTDSPALVALGAVDMALYAVGGRSHKPLNMGKVFEVMNSYDLGCGPGGGDNARQVFEAAGLAFSDGDVLTSVRKSMSCPKEKKTRKKRNVNFQKAIHEKLGEYASQEARRCCQDGLIRLPMIRSCEQRAARVRQPGCREPFLSCCQFAESLRKKSQSRSQGGLARALEALQEEDLIDEDDIAVRSFFPENWLWRVETVDRFYQLSQVLPDSLTTWEIHGVSLSASTGLCVATPAQLRVFREFHLHLRLPLSVRRFEQLELRPVLYNYLDKNLTVSVHVTPVEGLCLAGGGGLAQSVLVPASSARPVGFSVVPMAAAAVSLKVVARGSLEFPVGDAVSKVLQIQKEGAIHTEEMVYELNPLDHRGRTLEIPGNSDPNIIPDGDFSSFVRVTASDPLDTLGSKGALSPGGLASLLRVPTGCGEQTMILLAPTLAASRYLDKTEQWSTLPPETKDHAVDLIQKGYMRIQQFRKTDGSYGAWIQRDSSTWLTAFVLKVLSLAQEQVGGSPEKLQETARWLLSQQQADGSFQDPHPVIHRAMQGGLVGDDETVALTAFVVIALQHGLAVFQDGNAEQLKQKVQTSISKANTFLGERASAGILGAHAAAITAYALTLTKAPEDLRRVAHNNLMAMAQKTGDNVYWGSVTGSQSNVVPPTLAPRSPADPLPQAPALWIETTAYSLLHLLLQEGKSETADHAAAWLTHQGSFQGGFRSTQDTVMALDALSAYWIASHTMEERGLNVTLSSIGRNGFKSHELQLNNHQVQGLEEELEFSLGSKINVKIGGNSKGTLKILRTYNVLDMKNTTCEDLHIEVTVMGHVEYTMEANEDYEDYVYEELPAKDDPDNGSQTVTPLQLFERRRSRRRREAPKVADEQESGVQYIVCIWRKDKVGLPGMAIADITLLSGFNALRADLEKLTSLSDQYVSHFETEGPHVLLYFDSVPTSRECVGFGAVQEVAVGLVQPASATLYDYYNPEHKCSIFYGAPTKSKLLSTLCSADVCQCAEGKCPRQRRALERGLQEEAGYRMKFACYYPRVQYGFQVKVLREDGRAAFRLFETRISQVLHFTKDTKATAGQTRNFLVRASCRLRLEPGKEYLILGLDGATYDLKGDPQYLLDSNSWVEEMPSERLCRSTRHREACAQLNDFLEVYGSQGCQV
ncbi:LOW QUALITY PROTEIN: complement C4-A-like [Panthera pardus]|uniref:LOW QUALITY PROTEIN: complement C4-A-like n=1 Tax=Panthera pardus TaxID=9691 RepID=A0A9W2VRI3_PANPR|nr:complement C4-A-like [Panthera leo]XP_053761185.1 LOW QUALITY PROTEIN: complement C4-A-like [Panthera pardus]